MENLKYTEILQRNRELGKSVNGPVYTISILSNVTINSITELLEYSLRTHGINPRVVQGNYDNIVQDSSTSKESDLVIVFYETLNIADSVGIFFEDIDEELYERLTEKIFGEIDIIFRNLREAASVIFNTFSSRQIFSGSLKQTRIDMLVQDLNNYLQKHKPTNVVLADIDKIISSVGLKQSFDFRLYNSSKAPYTLSFLKGYVEAIRPVVLRNTGKLKKAIIFDCDNTLWKGILGEDGSDKIEMSDRTPHGKIFRRIQQIAVFLSKKGVIIELEPYLMLKAIRLGYRHVEVAVTKIYPPHMQGYTKMRPGIDWWSILRPVIYLGLGLKK